ncbi:hypothetical protein EVAR_21214_1 [Eumeta japonica]|uniref:DUF7041 domain-containing protein n=1 Tax=Eumeta variegata TaxID=151549 RepID=A0A4C1UNQ4_EUMVA|nr:hypothetical protein EVAR_21214_1 [Eumeta japonica]
MFEKIWTIVCNNLRAETHFGILFRFWAAARAAGRAASCTVIKDINAVPKRKFRNKDSFHILGQIYRDVCRDAVKKKKDDGETTHDTEGPEEFGTPAPALDQTHLREVKDIIVNPPTTDKYETFKTQLIKRLSDLKERKLNQLLMHEELGDCKPSQFLRYLQDPVGSDISKDLLITIWTSRLPQNIQTVIAGQTTPTLELLANLTDRVHEIVLPSLQIASTFTVSAHASTLENLTSEIT